MVRYLSAIGMSRWVEFDRLEKLIFELVRDPECDHYAYVRAGSGAMHFEHVKSMGPFQLTVLGEDAGEKKIVGFLPSVSEPWGETLIDAEAAALYNGCFMLGANEEASGEPIVINLTAARNLFDREGKMRPLDKVNCSVYGLSTEGKILLGQQPDKEEAKLMQEELDWRKDILDRIRRGDAAAEREMKEYARDVEAEMKERLTEEDVFTVLNGYCTPKGLLNAYSILGEILSVEKLLNPFSEEWVYRLRVSCPGTEMGVYINPKDLVGEPQKGRRLLAEVLLMGRLDPQFQKDPNEKKFF